MLGFIAFVCRALGVLPLAWPSIVFATILYAVTAFLNDRSAADRCGVLVMPLPKLRRKERSEAADKTLELTRHHACSHQNVHENL